MPNVSFSRLKAVIADLSRSGHPTLPRAAVRLGVSKRSLQRQLERSGLTYSDIVGQVRYENALSLLCETDLSVGEISAKLGYRDPSSFSRAFRRRAEQSPRRYRVAHTKRTFTH